MPCGNIDPYGITGTPVIDFASRTIFLDAMTTPDAGTTKKHLIFALSIDTGAIKSGWPVNVGAVAKSGTTTFNNPPQGQRGALAIVNGTLYVPYGTPSGGLRRVLETIGFGFPTLNDGVSIGNSS